LVKRGREGREKAVGCLALAGCFLKAGGDGDCLTPIRGASGDFSLFARLQQHLITQPAY
jgi:hypothetical protein